MQWPPSPRAHATARTHGDGMPTVRVTTKPRKLHEMFCIRESTWILRSPQQTRRAASHMGHGLWALSFCLVFRRAPLVQQLCIGYCPPVPRQRRKSMLLDGCDERGTLRGLRRPGSGHVSRARRGACGHDAPADSRVLNAHATHRVYLDEYSS